MEELRAAVDVATAGGTYVMAHVYGLKATRNCLGAGVRSIEYRFLGGQLSTRF